MTRQGGTAGKADLEDDVLTKRLSGASAAKAQNPVESVARGAAKLARQKPERTRKTDEFTRSSAPTGPPDPDSATVPKSLGDSQMSCYVMRTFKYNTFVTVISQAVCSCVAEGRRLSSLLFH